MSKSRTAPATLRSPAKLAARPEPAIPEPAVGAWHRFWFTPTDPVGLHCLRVLAGLLFLYWLLPLAGELVGFFSLYGWFDLQAYREFSRELARMIGSQPVNWSVLYLCGESPTALTVVYCLSLVALILFTLGVWPRLTAVLTWVVVASFVANPATQDEADMILPIPAFYLMLGYLLLGQRWPGRPLAWRLLGPVWPFGRGGKDESFWRNPSIGANVAVRLLQIHFALVMLASGLHKLQFGDWWAGLALWYPLHPPLETAAGDISALRPMATTYLFFLSLAAYLALAWQIGFPLFAWRAGRWRIVLLGGALVGWISTAWIYGVPVFGPALMVLCLAYLRPAEWHRLGSWLGARLSFLRPPALAGSLPQRATTAPRG